MPTLQHVATQQKRVAWILYGSETGNAQDVAEELAQLTRRQHFQTTVQALDDVQNLRDLIVQPTLVLFVVATAGQGEFPQNARSLWSRLLSAALRPERAPLRRLRYASCGLGDSSYLQYNVAHRALDARLRQLGARPICDRGEGNEQHPEGHAAGVREWILDALRPSLATEFTLPEGLRPIADDVFIEPAWKLRLHENSASNSMPQPELSLTNGDHATPSREMLPIRDAHTAIIASNERVTPVDHFQDVRVLDLHLPNYLDYQPGAVAVIYPKNFPEDVDQLIELMEWKDIADRPLELISTTAQEQEASATSSPLRDFDLSGAHLTLRWLLSNVLDIMSIPRRSFFSTLLHFAGQDTKDESYQRTRLLELADPALIDELWDYTTRPKRTILEVLMDFTTLHIPWEYALSTLPRMRGRQFSIASGGALKHVPLANNLHNGVSSANFRPVRQTRVQLLIAIVDPPSPIIKWRRRYGVCTRYVASLEPGTRLAVSILPGAQLDSAVANPETPLVLVGPGTGLAPLRSLLHERVARAQAAGEELQSSEPMATAESKPLANDLLFFGCRSPGKDDFFPDEWVALCDRAGLRRHVAYSRADAAPRQYVQHLLHQQAVAVREALVTKQGHFILCGSSGNMPKGVRAALLDVLAAGFAEQGGDADIESEGRAMTAAEQYLAGMEKAGRYKQETW